MQISRERIIGEIAKLNGERTQHMSAIEQHAAQVNACDGALIQCRAMLAIIDTPEPVVFHNGVPVDAPEMPPVLPLDEAEQGDAPCMCPEFPRCACGSGT